MKIRKVLVCCYGNTCRSPMLEGLLKRDLFILAKKGIKVESAGTRKERDNCGANPHSITCMQRRGIDITGHRRRYAGNLDLSSYHRIYVTGGDIKDALVKLEADADRVEVLCESIGLVPNPFSTKLPVDGQDLAKYISCAAILADEATRIASSL